MNPSTSLFFDQHIRTQLNTLKGGLYGLLLGDAVGRPYEFKVAKELPAYEDIDIEPPVGFNPTYAQVPIGTWTDDGAQALALLDSLNQKNGLQLPDFADKLCNWLYRGDYTPDGTVFDCGNQTHSALMRISQGVPVAQAAQNDEFANGNGALMRALPLALWHQGSDAELIQLAIQQGLPTHGHPRSGVVCALYCLMARRLIQQRRHYQPDFVIGELRPHLSPAENNELDTLLKAPERNNPQGTGYVVDTFWSALQAMESDNYRDVIRRAIALGNDTDTTACVAGGLAGLRFGYDHLPKDWLIRLQGRDLVERLFSPLERRIKANLCEEITLLAGFKVFAGEYRSGILNNTAMREGLTNIVATTLRPFWSNRLYSDYSPQNCDSISLSTTAQLEQITAFLTFINRCDHFTTGPIYFSGALDFTDGSLTVESSNPALDTAWHDVIVSGLFEIALDKLVAELALESNPLKEPD